MNSNTAAEMFESLQKFWNETMQITEARWVVWLTLLLVLVVTGIYLVKLVRDFAFGQRPSEADRINDMQTFKQIGALSDAEYRRAKEAMSGVRAAAGRPEADKSKEGEVIAFRELARQDAVDKEDGAAGDEQQRRPEVGH